ncbi:hypothetical protein GQ53DRAFT_620621, partial [Thozetella sp. PMI_491]
MSASRNADTMNPETGEFRSRVPRSEPMTTKGHAPGVKVGNDCVPEFSAQTYPPGTAPPEHTFQPNPVSEAPAQAGDPEDTSRFTRASALDSVPGATSRDVHNATEYGRPLQGQTSRETRGVHGGHRKKERSGLHGGGAHAPGREFVEAKARAGGYDLDGRAAEMKGTKGHSGDVEGGVDWQGAEERVPVRAEELAAER